MKSKVDYSNVLHFLTKNAEILISEGYYKEVEKGSNSISLINTINSRFCVIGELKRASPIGSPFFPKDEVDRRLTNIVNFSDAISVLTEPNFFLGSLNYLHQANSLGKPTIMKDFIISKVQINAAGEVSAILLIEKILNEDLKEELITYAHEKNIEVILEVDNENDFAKVLDCNADLIAINNRDLTTFEVEKHKASSLFKEYEPTKPVLGFSGYMSVDDILHASHSGLSGVLIGTHISKLDNPHYFLEDLRYALGFDQ